MGISATGPTRAPTPGAPSPISPWLRAWFTWYSRRYLRRHFHAIRLNTASPAPHPDFDNATVIYLNHAGWWDPLVCLLLWHHHFRPLPAYAPIDAVALEKYRFFRRLGFFPVNPDRRGAASFLRHAEHILRHPPSTLWVTPQGRFADARSRPLAFKPGLGHLASRIEGSPVSHPGPATASAVRFLPLAVEYTFWHERQPEILLRYGPPLMAAPGASAPQTAATWTQQLEAALEQTMDALAEEAQRRDPKRFTPLLAGRTGIGGPYDLWRRLRARWAGQALDPRHGDL